MNEEIQKLIERSEHALKVAKKLLQDEFFSDSASKSYYSILYATQALLKSEGIDVVKHSAVEAALGHYFSKTGKIDHRFHKIFMDAREVRELADYAISDDVIGIVASKKVIEAEEFINMVTSMLKIT